MILEQLDEYRQALEHYSKPRLDLIQWQPTDKGNVGVLNETIDLYRYFDATRQAEFLFQCVEVTVKETLPAEVDYLHKYDLLNNFKKNYIDMPDKLVDLLIRLLNHNNGKLSKRALEKEFSKLTNNEANIIQDKYSEIFSD